jgi:hypothetical protein
MWQDILKQKTLRELGYGKVPDEVKEINSAPNYPFIANRSTYKSIINLLEETIKKEGGSADLGKLVEAVENKHSNIVSEKDVKAVLDNSPQFKQLEQGNYTLKGK